MTFIKLKSLILSLLLLVTVFSATNAETPFSVLSDAIKLDDKIYCFDSDQKKVSIYSVEQMRWKNPVTFERDSATVFYVDRNNYYLGIGKSLFRYSLNGTDEKFLGDVAANIISVFTDDSLLIVIYRDGIKIMGVNDTVTVPQTYNGTSLEYVTGQVCILNTVTKTLCGHSVGFSPGDIGIMRYDSTGKILWAMESPYHGDFPYCIKAWFFPDGSKIIEESGIVYDGNNLNFTNNLVSKVTDVDFTSDQSPIVVYQNRMISYSASKLFVTGYMDLPVIPQKFIVRESDAVLFYVDESSENGIGITTVPLSQLKPDTLCVPPEPSGLSLIPENVFIGGDILYLFSKKQPGLYRWNMTQQKWMSTIALYANPSNVAYSQVNHAIYVSHTDSRMYVIHTDSTSQKEEPFVTLAAPCIGMVCAGKYLITSDASLHDVHFSFDPVGKRINYQTSYDPMYDPVWSESNRRIYFFLGRSSTAPVPFYHEDIRTDGSIVHNSHVFPCESDGARQPLRVRPDGQFFIVGDGSVFDALNFTQTNALPDSIDDAVWINNTLYTLGKKGISRWKSQVYTEVANKAVSGKNKNLLATSKKYLCVVTLNDSGVPVIGLYDTLFNKINSGTNVTGTVFHRTPPQKENQYSSIQKYFNLQGRLINTISTSSGTAPAINTRIPKGTYIVQTKSTKGQTVKRKYLIVQ